eukprot:scaffold3604_cov275-Pinguiococcus_pyrenoidosus.AAC.9
MRLGTNQHGEDGDIATQYISFTQRKAVAVMYWAQNHPDKERSTETQERILLGVDYRHWRFRIQEIHFHEANGDEEDSGSNSDVQRRIKAHREVILIPAGGHFHHETIRYVVDAGKLYAEDNLFRELVRPTIMHHKKRCESYKKFAPRFIDFFENQGRDKLQQVLLCDKETKRILKEWSEEVAQETKERLERHETDGTGGEEEVKQT